MYGLKLRTQRARRAVIALAVFGTFPGVLPDSAFASGPSAPEKSLPATPDWTYVSPVQDSHSAAALCTIGDVNGDGFSDVAVGAPGLHDTAGNPTGAVLVFFGAPAGLPATPSQVVYGVSYGAQAVQFGANVAPGGDFNHDGLADLLVAAPGYGGDGAMVMLTGSVGGLSILATWPLDDGDPDNGSWGGTLAPVGDVDGDGIDDFLVASPGLYAGNTGGAKIVRGRDGNPSGILWQGTGIDEFDYFGASAAGLGDVNGDGYADFAVAAALRDAWTPDFIRIPFAGQVGIYHGGPGGPGLNAGPATELFGAQTNTGFGVVCAAGDLNGDGYADVAVAASAWDLPGRADCGRVAVYPGSPTGVLQTPLWEGFGEAAGAQFGRAIAPAGDVNGDGLADLAIAAYTSGPPISTVRLLQGSRIAPRLTWTYVNAGQAMYGRDLATAGDVDGDGFSDLLVGSPNYTAGLSYQGRTQLFRGHADAPAAGYGWFVEGDQGGVYYGWDLAPAGDVNGDGYSDALLTAPGYSPGGSPTGLVSLHLGGPSGAGEVVWWATGESAGSNFGYAASGIGDVNGDGYDDVAAGAPYEGPGKVYVWFGHPNGLWLGAPDWTAAGQQAGSHFGLALAAAGDVNGDGYADLVVGAPLDDGDDFGGAGPANEGKAYVYLGSPTGLAPTPAWSARGGQAGANLGNSVGGAGDIDGDGYDDLVIGSEGWDQPGVIGWLLDAGRAQVFHGGAGGPAPTPATTLTGNGNANFGHVVDGAGDIDGDGYGDVIVTAVYSDPNNEGSAHVYRGSAAGLLTTAHWSFATGEAFAALGSSAAGAGDVNGDGLSDVIVGAVFGDGAGGQDSGRVWVFAGPLTGAAATVPLREWSGEHAWENLGNVVAGLGDLNGDGFADVGGGSPGYNGADWSSGRVVAWYGNDPVSADDVNARAVIQMAADVARPIGLGGLTAPGLDFSVRARSANPAGRVDVRLEWQVAGHGQPLSGPVARSPWVDAMPYAAHDWFAMNTGPLTPPGPGTAHWRVRVATNSPYFPHSPWLSPPRNGREQADLRRPAYVAAAGDVAAAPRTALAVSPNPFNPRTELAFDVPRGGRVRVRVFDAAGRLVATLLDEPRVAGPVTAAWDGRDAAGREVASGTYFARVDGAGQVATAKLTLIR